MPTVRNAHPGRESPHRRGTTLVEVAISLTILMMFLIGILDYSLASFRIQLLSHVAHRVAREAAVHGPRAIPTWRGGVWGPLPFTTTLADSDPVAEIGRTVSAGLDPAEVTVNITWPNGSNAFGSQIVVEASMEWTPSFFGPIGGGSMTLSGRSVQNVVH